MDRSDGLFDDDFSAATGGSASRPRDVRRYIPPAVSPRLLKLSNRLSQRRPPAAITMGSGAIAFAPKGIGSVDSIAPPDQRVTFHLLIDGRPAALQMQRSLYERILARIDPELLAADIDKEILPLLLESCIEDGITAAEAGLQSRIELVAVKTTGSLDLDGLDIALDIFLNGEKAGEAALSAGLEDIKRIAELSVARPKPGRSYGDLAVSIHMRAGAIWFDLDALRKLEIGDVLLVEDDEARWQHMAATVGERWLFPIDIASGKPTLRGPFRKADRKDQEDWMMVDPSQTQDDEQALDGLVKERPGRRARRPESRNTAEPGPEAASDEVMEGASMNTDIDTGPVAPPADAAFDELPVKLVFELGRFDMPLGELQEIGPGHVFELDRPLGEAVEIHASNRRIGQGEIVRIENQIGVRIVRLFGQGGA